MYGPVLLMAAFFGCVVFLMLSITPIIYASLDTGQATTASRITDVFQELQFTEWEPNPFTVTGAFASNGWTYDDGTQLQVFDSATGDEHPLSAILVRNASWPVDYDTGDYWDLWQTYGWFGSSRAEGYISLDTITAAYDDDRNYSCIYIQLRYTFMVVFWSDYGYLPDMLDTNNYNVSVGISLNDTLESVSPWTMLGKIMSFRMPGMNLFTNALIAVPIYTVLIYMAFAIIRSCIPLLGG